ncbi:replication protein A 70 kDa DNA-binding subunit isoform X2 [Anabrus simplex]
MRGGNVENPVMQILGHKKIASGGANERYRVLVSDGCHLNSFAMLATQLNGKLQSGELGEYTVIQINRYITSLVNNTGKSDKRVMIILDLAVLAAGAQVGLKIGNPVPLPDDLNSVANAENSRPTPQVNGPAALPQQNRAPPAQRVPSSPMDTMHTHPISSLNPYQNRWVIRARVTNKTPIKTWSNSRGEGKLFSMDLVDESGEIRATAFKEQCDKFYDLIEVNNVYFISRCSVKTANKQFSNLRNDYELSFTSDTQVIPCHDDSSDLPSLSFSFTPLQKLAEIDPNNVVDVIGVCKSANDVQTLIARSTNRELKKREVLIVDESNVGVNITLWGTQAEEFDVTKHPVVAIKGAKVNEFGGSKSVSVLQSSVLQLDPDIPVAHHLRGWFDRGGAHAETINISQRVEGALGGSAPWMTLHEARVKQLGSKDKADYFMCKATILVIRSENSIYKACPTAECKKKVIDMRNGMYRCEKCNQEFPNFTYRLLLSMNLGDWTGQQWVTSFQEQAEMILETTSNELGELADDNDKFLEVFSAAAFKSYIFKLRAKVETFNDESRMKTTVANVIPLNYKEYNRRLIESIKKRSGLGTKQ